MGIKALLSKKPTETAPAEGGIAARLIQESPKSPQFAPHEGSIDPTNPDLAILVVHGMGNQQPGHMIQRIGQPLVATINGWGENRDPGNTRLEPRTQEAFATEKSARFRLSSFQRHDQGNGDYEPPHAIIDIRHIGTETGYEKWLFAEAWWAEDYPESDFTSLAKWGLGLGPRILFRNIETSGLNGSMGWRPAQLPVALLLTVLFQAVVVALSTLRPIPKIGNAVNRVILALTTSLGDVNAMVARDMSRTAMLRTIDRTIDWLRAQSSVSEDCKLVVIAHSQGSYLSYEVLQHPRHKPVLFVTFGAVLKKIHLANHVQQFPERLSFGVMYAIGSALSVLIGCSLLWQAKNDLGLDRSTLDQVGVLMLALLSMTSLTYLNLLPLAANEGAVVPEKPILSSWKLPILASLLPPAILWFALNAAIEWRRPGWPDVDWPPFDTVFTIENWLSATFLMGVLIACAFLIVEWRHPDRMVTHITRLVASIVITVQIASILKGLDQGFSRIDLACLLSTVACACAFCAVPLPFGPANFSSPELHLPGDTAWLNFWAEADPFPDRGLNDVANPATIEDVTVINQNRINRDHSIYQENPEDFVTPLAQRLLGLTGAQMLTDPQTAALAEAQAKREQRVEMLTLSTWTCAMSFVLACLCLRFGYLAKVGIPLSKVRGTLETTLENLGIGKELITVVLDDRVLGLITVLAATVIWSQFVLFECWRAWDKSCARSMFATLDASSRSNANVASTLMLALGFAIAILAFSSGYIAYCIDTGTLHDAGAFFRHWTAGTWAGFIAVIACLAGLTRRWLQARL
jgi:hypothetical protein